MGAQAIHQRNSELHSPLSPLSPGSPLYPDGVFTPLWLSKHQQHVPSLLIAFFDVFAGEDAARNQQIQGDINAIRSALSSSGYRTRFGVVLMSDKSILHAPELEDRLSTIRRATALDSKSLFFMPPMSSQAEIATFVQSMLATLQPLILDYYRDHSKHSRRKKARRLSAQSTSSPIEGGAHMLPTSGWNARYEVKLGIFAEFRQEMDVAERHYSTAIAELFSSEGVLETIPSWSPKWQVAQSLCDAVATRVLRCQLWTGLITRSVVSWVNYKARMKDLIDRRGKGSQSRGWDAWEARWAEIMAEMLQSPNLAGLQPSIKQKTEDSVELAIPLMYASVDKALVVTERLPPFHFLHHRGYWLRLAIYSVRARLNKALASPEEHRTPISQSPISTIAHRAKIYDTSHVSEPGQEFPLAVTHGCDQLADLSRLTEQAVKEFIARSQSRAAGRLKIQLAQDLTEQQQYPEAARILIPLWEDTTWRDDACESDFT